MGAILMKFKKNLIVSAGLMLLCVNAHGANFDTREILKETENIKKQVEHGALNSTLRKETWSVKSLQNSLYNNINGTKKPVISDIDQGSYNNLQYFMSGTLNNCYLLTGLMHLAEKDPDFITNNLIKAKDNNENEIEVCLYKIKKEPKIVNKNYALSTTYCTELEPVLYTVTKDEVLNWDTSHRALWPVVIEIAYAKHAKNMTLQKTDEEISDILEQQRPVIRQMIVQNLKAIHGDLFDEVANHNLIESYVNNSLLDAAKILKNNSLPDRAVYSVGTGSDASLALSVLTGKSSETLQFDSINPEILDNISDAQIKAEMKAFSGVDVSDIKKFQSKEYSDNILKIYNQIKNCTQKNKFVSTAFRGVNPKVTISTLNSKKLQEIGLETVALDVHLLSGNAKLDPVMTILNLEKSGFLDKNTYEKWLKNNNLSNIEDLRNADESVQKEFFAKNLDYSKKYKISKTKQGISGAHMYLIEDVLEHDGYKYIVMRNPHQIKSKINYKSSQKISNNINLPVDFVENNKFVMELSHFYKKAKCICCEI